VADGGDVIDKDLFGAWWGVACERFLRPPQSPTVGRLFYETLNEAGLSDEEFEIGMRAVFRTSRFFPTPEEVIVAARQVRPVPYRAVIGPGPYGPDEETRARLREMFGEPSLFTEEWKERDGTDGSRQMGERAGGGDHGPSEGSAGPSAG
jgi:hypothetical protein